MIPIRTTLFPSAASERSVPWLASPSGSNALFIAALVLSACLHALTLTTSPPAWWDEVQFVDWGRHILPRSDTTYGVSIERSGNMWIMINYLGCALQEVAYRLAGGSMIGPRVSTMIGALAAAVALRAWLKAAGSPALLASVVACTILWEPYFAQSYRGGRVDCWCIAAMVTALYCIRKSAQSLSPIGWLIAGGVFVALSGLTWASAILLVPLLVHELIVCDESPTGDGKSPAGTRSLGAVARRFCIVGGTAAIALGVLLVPLRDALFESATSLSGAVAAVGGPAATRRLANFAAVWAHFLRSPILPASAILGAVFFGPRRWLIPFAVALCGVIATRAYGFRIIYLLPYLAYGWAVVANRVVNTPDVPWRRTAVVLTAVGMLVWTGGITLAGRTIVGIAESERRDPGLPERFIAQLVGDRQGRVLLRSWSLYYPLRARGWKYWGPYDLRPRETIAESLDYDLVIHEESAGEHPLHKQLLARGYTRHVFQSPTPPMRFRFLTRLTPGYGPYVVYMHPAWNQDNGAGEQARD